MDRWQLRLRRRRASTGADRPEMRPGTSGQSGKTVPTYFTDPEVDAPTIVRGSEIWTQPSMDRPRWRLSTLCKRTSISARTERRRSHAMERSPSRAVSTSPTKGMRYRRYYCRLDQLSDILSTVLSERISTLRRRPEASSVPDEVQVAEIRDRA